MVDDSRMRVTFLGTGTSTGVPVVACNCEVCKSNDPRDKRLRTSIMIDVKGQTVVIDCGPDFRFQMIRERVENISAVIFTHGHRDHIAGIDDIRGFNYVLNKTVDLYATCEVVDAINKEFSYILSEGRFFSIPQLKFNLIENKPFMVNGLEILPIEVLHHNMKVMGFRIGDFTYITDASFISDEEMEKAKHSKVLVINALRKSKHISHFSLDEALLHIQRLKPERAYITHLSHFMGLHDEVQAELPSQVFLAYDGLQIYF